LAALFSSNDSFTLKRDWRRIINIAMRDGQKKLLTRNIRAAFAILARVHYVNGNPISSDKRKDCPTACVAFAVNLFILTARLTLRR
jgi:hypothetical protein